MTKALYAFSGDPITYGHIDVIQRTLPFVDELHVGIAINPDKEQKYTFSLEERLAMAKQALQHLPKVKVVSIKGLLVHHAYEHNITAIIKGLRDLKDFSYEEELRKISENLQSGIDTIYIPANTKLSYISSSAAKAILKEQGDITSLVPLNVKQSLEARVSGQYLIGITGDIASGKSYICDKLVEIGKRDGFLVHNIDLDQLGHTLLQRDTDGESYETTRKALVTAFGADIQDNNGEINRKKLGKIVFADKDKLEILNAIMKDPLAIKVARELYQKKGLLLFNAALLAEFDKTSYVNNNVVLVTTSRATQQQRLILRGLNDKEIEQRLNSQYNQDKKRDIITKSISKTGHGKLFTLDNSANCTDREIENLFNTIVSHVDIYGELRFKALWQRLNPAFDAESEYRYVVKEYNQKQKNYHNLTHIVSMVNILYSAKSKIQDFDAMLLADYYHDIDPDEEKSSLIAYEVCKRAHLEESFAQRVKRFVIATKPSVLPITLDERINRDADFAILGAPEKEFDAYDDNIRKEYDWVPLPTYIEKRTEILQGILRGGRIYQTDVLGYAYEQRARSNLQRAIQRLQARKQNLTASV